MALRRANRAVYCDPVTEPMGTSGPTCCGCCSARREGPAEVVAVGHESCVPTGRRRNSFVAGFGRGIGLVRPDVVRLAAFRDVVGDRFGTGVAAVASVVGQFDVGCGDS